jgi:hypothetical protein
VGGEGMEKWPCAASVPFILDLEALNLLRTI